MSKKRPKQEEKEMVENEVAVEVVTETEETESLEITELPESATDPETGELIHFTAEDHMVLIESEKDIDHSIMKLAISFKKIRDKKLYLLRGYDNMKDYCSTHIRLSSRQVNRYLTVADAYSESKNLMSLSALPMAKLLETAKDPFLLDKVNSDVLSEEQIKEMVDEKTLQLEEENVKLKKQKKDLKGKLERLAEEKSKVETELSNYKNVPEDVFKRVSDKGQALKEIQVARVDLQGVLKRLESIKSDDPEVVSEVRGLIEQVKTYFQETQLIWG